MHILPYDYFANRACDSVGLARTATLIRQARAEVPDSLLLDNGDFLFGTPLDYSLVEARATGEHPMIAAMNRLGYDAVNLGNHEFDSGIATLRRLLSRAQFPAISANTRFEPAPGGEAHDPWFPPSVIAARQVRLDDGATASLKVGLVGVVAPHSIPQYDLNEGTIACDDMGDTVAAQARALRAQGADIVVALAHTGVPADDGQMPGDDNHALEIAALDGVDAVIAGHRHQVFPAEPTDAMPVVSAGFAGSHLGVIDLDLARRAQGWTIRTHRAETRPIASADAAGRIRPQVRSDPDIEAMTAWAHSHALDEISKPVGRCLHPISSQFALVAPNSAVQMIQRAKLWYATRRCHDLIGGNAALLASAASFYNGDGAASGQFTRIEPGPITMRDVSNLYPFPNRMVCFEMTGAQLRDWLERAASVFNQLTPERRDQWLLAKGAPGYSYETVLGVRYEIDLTQPARYGPHGGLRDASATRIRNLRHRGAPVAADQAFVMITNSFRAGGGGGYPRSCLTRRLPGPTPEIREVLITYFGAHPALSPTLEQNWRLAPVDGAVACLPGAAPTEPSAQMPDDAPRVEPTDALCGQQGAVGFNLYL